LKSVKTKANLNYCTRFCKQWRSKGGGEGGKWGHIVLSSGLRAHQHSLQLFKNMFQSRH